MSVLHWMVYYAALAFYLPLLFVLCLEEWVFSCLWLVITQDRFFPFHFWAFHELKNYYFSSSVSWSFSVFLFCFLILISVGCIVPPVQTLWWHDIHIYSPSKPFFILYLSFAFWIFLLLLFSQSPWAVPDLNNNATQTHTFRPSPVIPVKLALTVLSICNVRETVVTLGLTHSFVPDNMISSTVEAWQDSCSELKVKKYLWA